MSIIRKVKRALRGEVEPKVVVLESIRRARVAQLARKERSQLDKINNELPKLWLDKNPVSQLSHFQTRADVKFLPGFSLKSSALQRDLFPSETEELLNNARRIVDSHAWALLGFGKKNFGEEIQWRRDPLSGYDWPLDYHRDTQLIRNDGSDARVTWELNRLGHLLTLCRAYAVSGDETFTVECLSQLKSWTTQNPYGRGINWTCAMEVALRVMNLLGVFEMLKNSPNFDVDSLQLFLKLFHQHGTYISNNLEFSHISTSNHYFSDVAGLVWLGVMLPEFVDGEYFIDVGLMELLREMDKQILADGADFESSTGYHRYILELVLYSFILCSHNDIEIEPRYWEKLRAMLRYVRGYLRPDWLAPLIGDTDSGQVFPICRRRANEHAYVLLVGAALLEDETLLPAGAEVTPELLWLLGDEGVDRFLKLKIRSSKRTSQAFAAAGTYVLTDGDYYLCFNASDAGLNGRGSHGHNDSLGIEVFAHRQSFIVDPGTYVYSADLQQRHLFRSTSYHSTVKIDGEEQNTTLRDVPFVIGNEAKPRVLSWEVQSDAAQVVAEHSGYARLASPVIHRRKVTFLARDAGWLIEDEFLGEGEHEYEVRFHFAPGLRVTTNEASVIASGEKASLTVISLDSNIGPELESQATSFDYGHKAESITACWRVAGKVDRLSWRLKVSEA